jgi:hypothetical protein
MDLQSATEGASWHPLSMLITFESRAHDREVELPRAASGAFGVPPSANGTDLMFLPLWEFEHFGDYSTLLHEVAHLWCARTSRLGMFLIRAAAESFTEWADDKSRQVRLPERVHRVLGVYVPILEGLAMYAQLDFEAQRPGHPLPAPLALVTEHFSFSRQFLGASFQQIFRRIGDGLRLERVKEGKNTLQTLLLDADDTQNHYFVGYLYVKSIQALWSQKCPAFSDPALFLPVAIRVLCDNQILELAVTQTLTERQLFTAMHDGVSSICAQLHNVMEWLRSSDEFRESFDYWDVATQLSSRTWAEPAFYTDQVQYGFIPPRVSDTTLLKWAVQIGNSASCHIVSWHTGELRDITGLRVCLKCDGKGTWIELIFSSSGYSRLGHNVSSEMRQVEMAFIERLREHMSQQVTLALFVTLTRGSAGVAFWAAGKLQAWAPMTHGPFEDEDEYRTTALSLGISPADRQAFGQSFCDGTDVQRRIVEGRTVLLEQLVSSSRDRAVLGQRLNFLLFQYVPTLHKWCDFHGHEYPTLPEDVLTAGGRTFDLPGFRGMDMQRFSFAQLLPSLRPSEIANDLQDPRLNI